MVLPAGLEPFVALRWLQAGAEDLTTPLAGRDAGLPLPLDRLPLAGAEELWLRLPLDGAAGRALLVERTPAGRESEAERRTGGRLEADCAGLRSRE